MIFDKYTLRQFISNISENIFSKKKPAKKDDNIHKSEACRVSELNKQNIYKISSNTGYCLRTYLYF